VSPSFPPSIGSIALAARLNSSADEQVNPSSQPSAAFTFDIARAVAAEYPGVNLEIIVLISDFAQLSIAANGVSDESSVVHDPDVMNGGVVVYVPDGYCALGCV
jgi:hypothetical protein